MEKIYIGQLIKEIKACVDRHNLGTPGAYSRYTFGEDKDLGINEYGVADAANILYSIGEFTDAARNRDSWINVLQGMQDKETGMYTEATHHTIHTTAHCTAALELFDEKPLYKCTYLNDCLTRDGLYNTLQNGIRWATNPWRDSHIGAGLFVSLTNADMVDRAWKNMYFDWCYQNTDPESGFICYGKREAPLYQYMAGGFHYFFNHEAEHMPMRYPDKVIDSCLKLMNGEEPIKMLKNCGFLEIDVVYCLTRAMRQTPHRFEEGKQALREFAVKFFDMLFSIDYLTNKHFDDLHCLFGTVCCMAELQSALPGMIISDKPLKLVLDRRPFI